MSGSTTFNNLVCTTPNKSLVFTAGSTQTVSEGLSLQGSAGSLIDLLSSASGSPWYLDVTSAGPTAQYGDPNNSNASGGNTIAATNSIDGGSNVNWSMTPPAGTVTWTGALGTDWNTAGNSLAVTGSVSGSGVIIGQGATITGGGSFAPTTYSTTTATTTVGGGWSPAQFTNNNGTVALSGTGTIVPSSFYNLTENGAGATGFSAGTGTVVFMGGGAPLLAAGGAPFNELAISGGTAVKVQTNPLAVSGQQSPGQYSTSWDGRNFSG